MAKMTLNEQFNGVEIFFEEKPDTKVLEQLKANGFRWHNFKKVWYAKQSEKTLTLATSICGKSQADKVADSVAEVVANLHKDTTPKAKAEPKKAEAKKVVKMSENKKQTTPKTEKAKEPENDTQKIVAFQTPKKREPIAYAFVEGAETYEHCAEKLAEPIKKYTDTDNQFCLASILKFAEASPNFRNCMMRTEKTYEGALEYCANKCKEGFGFLMGNMGMMSSDMALPFMLDYFMA